MESLLLDNLRKNQTFAAAVRKGSRIDALANGVLQAVLSPAEGPRKAALAKVEGEIVQHFAKQIQPAARAQGQANARAVLAKLGPSPDLSDPATRRQILTDGSLRPADRLRIVQAIVNDKANTLDNRLTAYWLEPGRNPREKLEHLKQLHFEQERKRHEWEAAMLRYQESGETGARPRRPNLDFLSKFTADVKQGTLEQARRAGTDAELEAFVKAGEEQFSWVTVNASDACPQCRERQGWTGDAAFWDREGRPGGGATFCGSACFCQLIPSRTLDKHPGLRGGLNTPGRPAAIVSAGTDGPPALVLTGFHGSPHKFDKFKLPPGGPSENKWGPGVYFAPGRQGAVDFVTNAAKEGTPYHLYEAEVTVRKPLRTEGRLADEHFDAINRAAGELGLSGLPENFRGNQTRTLYKLLTTNNNYDNSLANAILRKAGFDAVIDTGEFVALNEEQITIKKARTYKAKSAALASEAPAPATAKGLPLPPPPGAHPEEVRALHEEFVKQTEGLHAKLLKAQEEAERSKAALAALPLDAPKDLYDARRYDAAEAQGVLSLRLYESRQALAELYQSPGNLTASGNRNIVKEANVHDAMALARPLFGAGSPMERSPVVFQRSRSDRAYFEEGGGVFIGGKKTKPTIILHEMGHDLEARSAACRQAAQDFLERRAAGEAARPLSEITGNPGYGKDEVAKEDKFFDPYCGKVYDDGSTEITSMGIQRLVENPVAFAREDPDYFQFTLAQLRRRD